MSKPALPEKPVMFNWLSSEPVTGSRWPEMRDSLLSLLKNDNRLEITAWYCTDEKGNISPDSLGQQRAEALKALFGDTSDQKILLRTREVSCEALDTSSLFEASGFVIRRFTGNIIETPDETTIYFPGNSARSLQAEDVEKYLDSIATRVLASGEIIILTGHTDNIGSEKNNILLGKKRADILRDYLVAKGVSPDKIEVHSEGEKMPAADNETPEGRAKNRRTTLRVISSSK
jgi:outer membrane protein OmpA-like peptidoglycan-associated protein